MASERSRCTHIRAFISVIASTPRPVNAKDAVKIDHRIIDGVFHVVAYFSNLRFARAYNRRLKEAGYDPQYFEADDEQKFQYS